jgi:hypothetical protein
MCSGYDHQPAIYHLVSPRLQPMASARALQFVDYLPDAAPHITVNDELEPNHRYYLDRIEITPEICIIRASIGLGAGLADE